MKWLRTALEEKLINKLFKYYLKSLKKEGLYSNTTIAREWIKSNEINI